MGPGVAVVVLLTVAVVVEITVDLVHLLWPGTHNTEELNARMAKIV